MSDDDVRNQGLVATVAIENWPATSGRAMHPVSCHLSKSRINGERLTRVEVLFSRRLPAPH